MRAFAATALHGPPFKARLNSYVTHAADRSARWAVDFGLVSSSDAVSRLSRANAAELAGRACPDSDPDRLVLLTDLINWLFAFDDNCDDDGLGADPRRLSPVVAGLLDVVDLVGEEDQGEVVGAAGPVGVALHDLCRRVRAQHRPELLLRFTAELRGYLLSLLWEAANREHLRVPTVAEYVQMRRHTGAVRPSFTLTDIAHDARPDAVHLTDPRLSRLDRLAADLVCWCNDVFSYDKERRVGPNGHNLAMSIAAEAGGDERSALAEVANRFNSGLDTYLRLEASLLAEGDPEVARFTEARRCWIRGTYDWSMTASRYH